MKIESKMKFRAILLLLLLFVRVASIAQPELKLEKTTQHLGFVHQGDTLRFQYKFTNTGDQPLIISDTKVECGCTVVDTPKDPIMPGKQGIMNVVFHTNSAIDRQDRTVTILSNAKNSPVVVRFKCVVLKAKKT